MVVHAALAEVELRTLATETFSQRSTGGAGEALAPVVLERMMKVLLETRCGCTQIIEVDHPQVGYVLRVSCGPSTWDDYRNEQRTFQCFGDKNGFPWFRETVTERIETLEELQRRAKIKAGRTKRKK